MAETKNMICNPYSEPNGQNEGHDLVSETKILLDPNQMAGTKDMTL
jgi:hypothetical protein